MSCSLRQRRKSRSQRRRCSQVCQSGRASTGKGARRQIYRLTSYSQMNSACFGTGLTKGLNDRFCLLDIKDAMLLLWHLHLTADSSPGSNDDCSCPVGVLWSFEKRATSPNRSCFGGVCDSSCMFVVCEACCKLHRCIAAKEARDQRLANRSRVCCSSAYRKATPIGRKTLPGRWISSPYASQGWMIGAAAQWVFELGGVWTDHLGKLWGFVDLGSFESSQSWSHCRGRSDTTFHLQIGAGCR